MNQEPTRQTIVNIIQAELLLKFLNDPRRLGMTEQQQKDHIATIEALK